jgi:hypothetical protein
LRVNARRRRIAKRRRRERREREALTLYYETLCFEEPMLDFDMVDETEDDDHELWCITFFGEPAS